MILSRKFLMAFRQALLLLLGALEEELEISPTTKDCREMARQHNR